MGRPRRINHDQVVKLINEKIPAKKIAEQLSISYEYVYMIAKNHNLEVVKSPNKKKYNDQQIISLYFEMNQIGYHVDKHLNIPLGTTAKILQTNHIQHVLRMGRIKENKTLETRLKEHPDWNNIYKMYLQGLYPKEIDDMLSLRKGSAARILQWFDKPDLRGRTIRYKNINSKEVVELYNSGLGANEIRAKFECSSKVIYRILDQENIQRRVGKASGSKNPQWKGGKEITVYLYRRQSYEVVAICLGKPVPKGYVIHHLDENPKYNHPDNLILFPSNKEHMRFHQKVLKTLRTMTREETIQMALETGAIELPKPPSPIEF